MSKRTHVAAVCTILWLGSGALYHASAGAQIADAQITDAQVYAIAAGDLNSALRQFSQQSRVQLIYPTALVDDKVSVGLSGSHTAAEALRRLLDGSGLESEQVNDKTIVLRRAPGSPNPEPTPAPGRTSLDAPSPEPRIQDLEGMSVTGTRIRGGITPSPVTIMGSERIREEGFTDLGEVIRNLPQNFSGGQNPGVANGATLGAGGGANQNITGGSSLNLRGLGPDATLTLLNGRRMAYGGFVQAVDISAIPLEAVDRIEIVTDGASAIYGSDAVGGVGNVILKRDYDGAMIGARYARTTDGGLATREYSGIAGVNWSAGGLILTYKTVSADPIYARERSYTDHMLAPTTIYPGSDLRSGLISAYQGVGENVELRLDALRTEREQLYYRYNSVVSPFYNHYMPETTTTLVSPSMDVSLSNGWTLSIGAAWGKDERNLLQWSVTNATGASALLYDECLCNKSSTYEVGAEGPLFALPGGDARLAVGIGQRKNEYVFANYRTDSITVQGDERARFAYLEASLPLIGSDQNISGVERLMLTAAVRGEDYDSFGRVMTPKLGLIYGLGSDLTLRTSWGRSFKAPTLQQRNYSRFSYLHPPGFFGGTGYAESATVFWTAGGNRDLDPERARTWTASLAYHPRVLPGLEAELTWFHINYTDRVVEPITNYAQAMNIPAYREFITYSPTAEDLAALMASADSFMNFAGAPYDPNNVVAIIRTEFLNVARQKIRGFDLSGAYRFDLGPGTLAIRGSVSWLNSSQRSSPTDDAYDVAGTLFNPAKVNGRMGVVWDRAGFSISAFANHVAGVTDTVNDEKKGSFNTFDATLRYFTGERSGPLAGLGFVLSAHNLFDRGPSLFTPVSATHVPYDSTNHSAIGRLLSVSISKQW